VTLTCEPVAAVVADKVDGGVDHVEGDVEARLVLGAQATAGHLEKVPNARTSLFHRGSEK
jgi:hypothetical protein